MEILGYETGPIACQAAFTSDFAVPTDMPVQQLVNNVENERPSMDGRPGMRHKYMPLRFDPATGAHQVGGRYLFDSWDDVVDYIEMFYNSWRKHSYLGYVSPNAYEKIAQAA